MDWDKAGYVYVLQMERHPYYKIGRTINLTQRIKQISPQMPGRALLLFAHKVRDAWRVESALHKDFQGKRLNGEWFHLNDSDLTEIKFYLLTEQAVILCNRIFKRIEDTGLNPLTRYSHTLHKAALRKDRRMRTYFAHHYREAVVDEILESEFVL